MPFSMSQTALPIFEIGLNALSGVLDKAAAFIAAKKVDAAVLLGWRLAPDMFALARQVQVACDQAKNGAARLAGVEPPKFEDNETDPRPAQGAHRQDRGLSQDARCQGDRRLGRPRDHLSARAEQGPDAGRRLPQSLRAAEFLFPSHRGLRHRAPLRRRGRQARLSGRHSDQARPEAVERRSDEKAARRFPARRLHSCSIVTSAAWPLPARGSDRRIS